MERELMPFNALLTIFIVATLKVITLLMGGSTFPIILKCLHSEISEALVTTKTVMIG
ncbi:MAG: hypothetical protein MJE68_25190 [Proteobacteria bacterium]|nr:hypothetical protein [Pseudomonadota bacterium]